MPARLALALQAAAGWATWAWFARRMTDGSDEPYGIIALLALGVLCGKHQVHAIGAKQLVVLAVVNVAVAVGAPWMPPTLRGAILACCVASILAQGGRGSAWWLPAWMLAALSVPSVTTLQFYLGYPMRWWCAAVAARVLSVTGMPIAQEGAGVIVAGEPMMVDAPCSGVRMLWTGMFLVAVLMVLHRLPERDAWRALIVTLAAVLVGNAMRVCGLVLLAHMPMAPAWMHEGVGIVMFSIIACAAWFMCSGRCRAIAVQP